MKESTFSCDFLTQTANILTDIAQVFFAAVTIPAIFDRYNLSMITLGLCLSLSCWIASLFLVLRRRVV